MKVLFFLRELQFFERMGIMSLSAVLKKEDHQVNLLKTQGLNFNQIMKKIKEYSPDVFAFSMMTGEHNYYLDLNKRLKKKFKAFSIFGGPHPTFFPEMIKKTGVDAVCIGEGEGAMIEFLEKLEKGRSINRIRNLWLKKGNKVIKNPLRPLIEDLDNLPFPDREILYENDSELREYKSKLFFSGRGCPYQCTYCFNHKYNEIYKNKGKVVRFRSVDNFIAEILAVKKRYPFEFAEITDDTFLLKPQKWLEEFAIKMRKTKIRFWCNIRINLVNEQVVRLLKKAGCHAVWFGIECGNEEIRNQMLKRFMTDEQILRTFRLLKKYDIVCTTQNLIGLPVENPLKIDLQTLDLNIKCRPDFAWSSILYPYPGTSINKYAVKNGYFRKKNWDQVATTNKVTSELIFKNSQEKKKVERLHKLFGIIVEFPFLRRWTGVLISLPLDKIYQFIFFTWYGYCMRIRMESWKKTPSDLLRLSKALFGYLRSINRQSLKVAFFLIFVSF